MEKKNVLSDLLFRVNNNRRNIFGIADEKWRQQKLLKQCDSLYTVHDRQTVNNIKNIIQKSFADNAINAEQLVYYLSEKEKLYDTDLQYQRREAQLNFDATYGTTTSPILEQYELNEDISPERFFFMQRYYPSPVNTVRQGLDRLQKYGVDYSEYTFVDVGSGMGRNLLLASEYPFQKIIGVEISNYLHEIAAENIQKYQSKTQRCSLFDLQCVDALKLKYPKTNLVMYFFETFGEEISTPFIDQLSSFVTENNLNAYLIFLNQSFPRVTQSPVFSQKESLRGVDLMGERSGYFQLTIYANC